MDAGLRPAATHVRAVRCNDDAPLWRRLTVERGGKQPRGAKDAGKSRKMYNSTHNSIHERGDAAADIVSAGVIAQVKVGGADAERE